MIDVPIDIKKVILGSIWLVFWEPKSKFWKLKIPFRNSSLSVFLQTIILNPEHHFTTT